jgi:antitoxin ParD1/3/4
MEIELSEQAMAWVREQVASGRFSSESELFMAALRIMAAFEAGELPKLESLRRDVAAGLAELDAGLGEPWDVEQIKTEGRRRLLARSEA